MADADLHSAAQRDLNPADVPPALQAALAELQGYPRARDVRLISWNDTHVAITLSVDVARPSRGTPSGADIRGREPLLLVFNKQTYPYKAPYVRADRKDFPADLPHLNPVPSGSPQWFCLHRGDLDDWFAEHSLAELVRRAQEWLHDAAHGTLMREADRFETTRIATFLGFSVFPYEEYTRKVLATTASGSEVVLFELLKARGVHPEQGFTIYHSTFVDEGETERYRAVVRDFNSAQGQRGSEEKMQLGLLLWPDPARVDPEYFGVLPSTFGELAAFGDKCGIDVRSAIRTYNSQELGSLVGVPVLIAVRRPQPLIGQETNIELISFVVRVEHTDAETPDDAPVYVLTHVEPMTPESARRMSRREDDPAEPRTLVLGLGALGSKIALHRGRGGDDAMTLVDTDVISPHNLVRHALLRSALGGNKAEATRDEIGRLFQGGADRTQLQALKLNAFSLLAESPGGPLSGHGLLLDCTASKSVLHALVDATLPEETRTVRAEIAHRGQLGFWLAEGPGRSPRLDDLQTALFAQALRDPTLSQWLQHHRDDREDLVGAALEDITVGVSCNSTTLRLADDVVSYHAASISLALRDLPDAGEIGVVSWTGDGHHPAGVRRVTVSPTVARRPAEAPGWTVRYLGAAADDMRMRFLRAADKETGGVLYGRIDPKRQIVYVAYASAPPPDSVGHSYVFRRGIEGLHEQVEEVDELTGGLITYVGEWHTHPRGSGDLSSVDQKAVDTLQAIHAAARFPTLVTIVTPLDIVPHLFVHG